MEIILKKTKEVAFKLDNVDGKFICKNPKASDFVSFWAEFRAVEGTEKEKNEKQVKLVVDTFLSFVEDITFDKEVSFKDEDGKDLDTKEAIAEYFSFMVYQKGMEFLNPSFGGSQSDPLEQSSAAS